MNKVDDEEEDLKNFFSEIKTKDELKSVPEFLIARKQKQRWLIPIGVAASLAIFLWFAVMKEPPATANHQVIIITLEKGKNQEIQFTIEESTELESWESTTSSLLTEF